MAHPMITTEPAAPLWPTGSDIEVKVRRVTAIEVGAIEHGTVDHPTRPGEALDYYHRPIRLRDDRGGELRLDLHAWTERALYMATQHDVADLIGELAAAKTERKPLGLRAGPAMLTTPEWADQIVEPTDRRVPLHPDRGRV